ncbi:MAG: hypothetical protein COZ21_05075 [Bacteroidetes bacterium CG_4_10_14_3_um_filter_31_20]|nr:hypothetical protein [Bacteroidota bacterium]PIX36323.1 MAG: hypothetical protein COZ59_01705 [Bacteroidetes bacterium CG_4_8_14_3_um_filter_31_14]PIY04986.1 MAG: hypothetical protein COZ21_05075 [Bacteroidetes bacterium CG_4_10_14_3_um_filter_31_20]
MAICAICNTRKGKRKCIDSDTFVCSQCCGSTRNTEKCTGCEFNNPTGFEKNPYISVPGFSIKQMADNISLQNFSEVIENEICKFDYEHNMQLKDDIALHVLELLLDKFYFKKEIIPGENELLNEFYNMIIWAISKNLQGVSQNDIAKILKTIYASVKRHTLGKREYFDFILKFIGIDGMRIIGNKN